MSTIGKQIFGISYVSVWILIWGTVGSLIDAPLLAANIYNKGSIGQVSIFTISGIISTVFGIFLFSKVEKLSFIQSLISTDNN